MDRRIWGLSLVLALLILLAPCGVLAASNTITITNRSDAEVVNYPLQFGRPFIRGEIHEYPQVVIGGVPVATQADIKNRFPDGSVAFAVISLARIIHRGWAELREAVRRSVVFGGVGDAGNRGLKLRRG